MEIGNSLRIFANLMGSNFFISGIGTDVGKTLVSKILCRVLHADYWKPMQSGELHDLDSEKVATIQQFPFQVFLERYLFSKPLSPHAAASFDGISVELTDFKIPHTERNLIIEGAGGLHVPINQRGDCIIDLVAYFEVPTVLVSRHYLGSINHTLLSINALRQRNIPITGIVFVGNSLPETEEIIMRISEIPVLARIPHFESLTDDAILGYCESYGEEIRTKFAHGLE